MGWLFIRIRKDNINKRITDYVLKIVNNVEDRREDEQSKDPNAK
jgi:hypothetical protein